MLTDMDISFWGWPEIIMIKHGSANVTKVPKLYHRERQRSVEYEEKT